MRHNLRKGFQFKAPLERQCGRKANNPSFCELYLHDSVLTEVPHCPDNDLVQVLMLLQLSMIQSPAQVTALHLWSFRQSSSNRLLWPVDNGRGKPAVSLSNNADT